MVAISVTMADSIKRRTTKRTEAANAIGPQELPTGAGGLDHSGQDNGSAGESGIELSSSEIEWWVDNEMRGMENALRANSLDARDQYEKQTKDLQ